VGDVSKTYKLWYNVWLNKEAKRIIDDAVKAGIPPPSEKEARKIVQSDPQHEVKFRESALYDKYVVRGSSKGARNATTSDRFTASVLEKRAQQVMKEKPELSEEQAMKQADKDLQTRQDNEATDVAGAADPVSAKILTNISSILMDISEDVLAIRESGPSGLDAAESGREKGKDGKEKEKLPVFLEAFKEIVDTITGIFKGISLVFSGVLIPLVLGFASKFIDFSSSLGLVIAAVIGFATFFGSQFLFSLIIKSISSLFMKLGTALITKALKIPTTPTVPGTTPVPGGTSIPGPAGKTTKSISALTTLGKGIKDLGAGIGAAIYSFFAGFAKGLAAFGNPKTALGIAVMVGATAALGGLALLFKKGDIKWEDFIAVGVGLGSLALGIMALGNPLVITAMNALANPAAAKGLAATAIAIAVLGAALIPGAYAFNLFGEALKLAGEGTEKMIDNLFKLTEIDVDALYKIGPALMSVGLGFAAFNAAMAVGALAGIGQSIASFFGADSPIDTVLNFAKDAADADIVGAANAVDQLTKSLQKLSGLELDNLNQIGEGLTSLSLGMGAFAVSGVVSGLGNLVTGFLSKVTGQKTPVEQIQELAKDSKSIYDAGIGVESIGKGLTSFNSIDPDKITRTIEYLDNLDDAQLKKLSSLSAVGTQQAQTQQLAGAREQAQSAQTRQVASAQNTVVQQNAVNNSSMNFSSTKMGSAVQGDALSAAK